MRLNVACKIVRNGYFCFLNTSQYCPETTIIIEVCTHGLKRE